MNKKERIERAVRAYDRLAAAVPEVSLFPVEELLEQVPDLSKAYVKQVVKEVDRSAAGGVDALNDDIVRRLTEIGRSAIFLGAPRVLEAGSTRYVVVADAHFGLTPHSRVGAVSASVQRLLELADGETRVVFLGDTLHSDTYHGATTRGTRIEVGRPPEQVIPEVVDFVQALASAGHSPLVLQGNHDMLGATWLAASIGQRVDRTWVSPNGHVGMYHGDKDLSRVYGELRALGLDSKPAQVTILEGHTHVFNVRWDAARGWVITCPAASPRSAWAKDEGYAEVPAACVLLEFDAKGKLAFVEFDYIED